MGELGGSRHGFRGCVIVTSTIKIQSDSRLDIYDATRYNFENNALRYKNQITRLIELHGGFKYD